jgi:hypothetical protein
VRPDYRERSRLIGIGAKGTQPEMPLAMKKAAINAAIISKIKIAAPYGAAIYFITY